MHLQTSKADDARPTLLLTSGPTREPIDAVRYLGNRSSGRMGAAIADAAAEQGWHVIALVGEQAVLPEHPGVEVHRFESTADLEAALAEHLARADTLVMAAAVADYRPAPASTDLNGKMRRRKGFAIDLEPTPDLLEGCSRSPDRPRLLVGFALEPAEALLASASNKLVRKGLDLIVANPLETMDSPDVDATLLGTAATAHPDPGTSPGIMSKRAFASWLIEQLTGELASGAGATVPGVRSGTVSQSAGEQETRDA